MNAQVTLETLARRVERLEDEMQALRAEVHPELTRRPELVGEPVEGLTSVGITGVPLQRVPLVPEEQEVVDLLATEGLIAPPTPRMLRAAAEWEARPAEEREAGAEELRSLWLDPPLSEIIIRMRRGENVA